jgi:hypothetical protein
MGNRDIRDVVGGLAMMVLGAFVGWYAYSEYEIGQLNRMGPGFFPVGLGLLLAVIGFFIALPAFFRSGEAVKVEVRTLLSITTSIIAFSFLLKSLGIVLATIVAVLISSIADREISWKGRILVAIGVAAMTWVVFILGLSMVLPVWPWSP